MLRTHLPPAFVVLIGFLVPAASSAEVVTVQLAPGTWTVANHYFGYQDLPVHLGFGVAAVDSVRVDLIGTSHLGIMPLGCHPECASIACNESIVAGFVDESGAVNCQSWYAIQCDAAMAPCVGAAFSPTGDLQYFDLERKVTGLTVDCEWPGFAFVVADNQPGFGALFADGDAVLRLRRVFGNDLHIRCLGGLADLVRVDVHVYFDAALAVDSAIWGTLKAWYR